MPVAAEPRRPQQPLYREILERLAQEIAAGSFAVGDRLPTEFELCARFRASRHTVRAALRHLQEQGLIVRRQGSGSVVAAAEPRPRFSTSIGSLEELMQYAAATRLELLSASPIVADRALAALLPCAPGSRWIRVEALRRAGEEPLPLAHTLIFIPARFGPVVPEIGSSRLAVCQLIERRFGLRLSAVRQSIEAVAADADIAGRLTLRPGDPVLRIDRRYEAAGAGLIEAAFNTHPPDRFRYELVLRPAP